MYLGVVLVEVERDARAAGELHEGESRIVSESAHDLFQEIDQGGNRRTAHTWVDADHQGYVQWLGAGCEEGTRSGRTIAAMGGGARWGRPF